MDSLFTLKTFLNLNSGMSLVITFGLAFACFTQSIVAWNGFQDTLVPAYFYPGSEWDKGTFINEVA